MTARSYRFTHAITRRPAESIIRGLRAVDTGTPSLALMEQHHADYIAALKSTGASVVELDKLEAYPDSVFVEDTALCLPEGAVVMRPGAPTRLGEAAEMAPHLTALYSQVCGSAGRQLHRGRRHPDDRNRDPRRPLCPHQRGGHRGIAAPRRPLGPHGARGLHPARRAAFQDRLLIAGRGDDPVHRPPGRLGLLSRATGSFTCRGRGSLRQHDPLQRSGSDARRFPPDPRHAGQGRLHGARDRQFGMRQAGRRHVLPVAAVLALPRGSSPPTADTRPPRSSRRRR